MKFSVVTILPELVEPTFAAGVVGRAVQAGTISVETINPRDFTTDKHRSVDDTPYGGGPGMVMRPGPLLAAIDRAAGHEPRAHRILLSPAGTPLTQARIRELARLPHLVLVCGRYEGIDERVLDAAIDEQISIGDYVLTGGELGALVIIDAVARLVPGVLGDDHSADDESFSNGLLEYPQYTRPADGVPAILAGGNHAAIEAWRRTQSMIRTATRRPDLWARFSPSTADEKLLAKAGISSLHARTHLALVHHPVMDRTGAVITSALTNFDIHDLARSSMTYGLAGYHLVTPITSQRDKADGVARLWMEEAARSNTKDLADSRARALRLVRTHASIEALVAELDDPIVVATTAREDGFPGIARQTPRELVTELTNSSRPMLLLLGTGWGLASELIPSVSRVLTPIDGRGPYNHLSVRSAGAILLDRLFGRDRG